MFKANSLLVFVIKVFILLPLCYWLWYSSAESSTFLAVYFSEPVLQSLFPGLIAGIEQNGYLVEVVANVTVPAQNVPRGMIAELPVPVNPLIYSYGLPLTLALILASPINHVKTGLNILISIFIFLLIQVWGISFESLKVLFLQTPPELLANNRLDPGQLDFIALGYQLGALILPAVTPIIIWVFCYQKYIALLTRGLLNNKQG